jgi:tetratricopeptide (TPR) repeat protein
MLKAIVAITLLAPSAALAQDANEVRRLFEAGRYQQAAEAATDSAPPAAIYTAAQSHQRLGRPDAARDAYASLAALPEDDPWHFIGASGQQLVDGDTDGALQSADRAAQLADSLAEAHYQRGLVLARREDWRAAADAFTRASDLNPALAYAHYYGGLMQYRSGRPDRMAIHFEQFLKLAPDAPERPEVTQIMRTIRGR